jgi:hypothetical protein
MRKACLSLIRSGLLALLVAVPAAAVSDDAGMQDAVERVPVETARSKVLDGTAFLVCAYDDKRCEGLLLEGALTRREFEWILPTIPADQEIIIYCS